jgi:hypothetical protein
MHPILYICEGAPDLGEEKQSSDRKTYRLFGNRFYKINAFAITI